MNDLIKKNTSLIVNDQKLNIGDVIYSKNGNDVYKIIDFEETDHGARIIYTGCKYREDGISSMGMNDFKSYYSVAKNISYDEVDDIATKILSGDFDIKDLEPQKVTESVGLMKIDKTFYQSSLKQVEELTNKANAIKAMVESKMDTIKNRMRSLIQVQQKIIQRLRSVIFTIELYAGIEESVKQIQSGEFASDSDPIYLNQLMKYMDEEVGDPSYGGLSFDNLDDFDNWLLTKNDYLKCFNYELLLPKSKSVRIMRVRRNISEKYSRDVFENRWEIKQEMNTYVIVRNGENIYTIDSKMQFSDKLFPEQKELTKIMEIKNADDRYDKLENYKNGMVLMQGLVDRTTIFGNIAGQVSFLNPKSSNEGKVVFQYENDESHLVTDGSKTFLDFLNTTSIEAGDRIYFLGSSWQDVSHRLYKQYYSSKYQSPQGPDSGIYKIEEDKDNNCLYFKYLPEDKVYNRWSAHERKNRLSYKIYPSDDNIVNIDCVSHRDIEWLTNMMYDRRDRIQYLKSAGLLLAIKKAKNEELEKERPFALMLMSAFPDNSELEILDAIHWWKTKNKHKRALTVDDQKAFRMIKKYLVKN